MNVLLYAHNGSENHGCEALVRSTASLLEHPVTLFSTAPQQDLKYGIDQIVRVEEDTIVPMPRRSAAYIAAALQTKLTGKTTLFTKYMRGKLLAAAAKADVCLSIGGDNYCYGGTEILGDLNELMKRSGTKTVLWGCSIDPEVLTPAIVKDLKRYDLITVREQLTQEALERAGVAKNVRAVADSAFLLPPAETVLPEGFVPGNTIGLNLSPLILDYTDRKEEAMGSFHRLICHILEATDSTILLLPHVTSDLTVLQPLYERYRDTGRVILAQDRNCMELKTLISQCRLFIGARTHATIAAYSTHVPTLVVGYSVKSRGIARDLFGSEEHYVIPVQATADPTVLTEGFDWLLSRENEIRSHLESVIPGYRELACSAANVLKEL